MVDDDSTRRTLQQQTLQIKETNRQYFERAKEPLKRYFVVEEEVGDEVTTSIGDNDNDNDPNNNGTNDTNDTNDAVNNKEETTTSTAATVLLSSTVVTMLVMIMSMMM